MPDCRNSLAEYYFENKIKKVKQFNLSLLLFVFFIERVSKTKIMENARNKEAGWSGCRINVEVRNLFDGRKLNPINIYAMLCCKAAVVGTRMFVVHTIID